MPKLPQYQPQTSARGPSGLAPIGLNGDAVALGQLGGALRGVANDALQVQQIEKQQAEERGAVWANEQSMANRSRWTTRLPELMEEAPEDGTGFAKQALEEFDQNAADMEKEAPTARSRSWIRQNLAQQRLTLQGQGEEFERQRGVEFKVSGTERALDGAKIAAEARPQDFGQIASDNDIAIQAAGFTPKLTAEIRQKAHQSLSGAAVQGMIRRDPYQALEDLSTEKPDNEAVRGLTFEQRLSLRNAAEAEINRRESEVKSSQVEARQAMDDQLRDIQVAATNGMTITNLPSQAVLKGLYGDHEGTQKYEQTIALAALSPKVSKMYGSPASEVVATVEAFKPTQVEGAADQFALLGVMQQKAASILKEREADAGGYLTKHSSSVGDAWAAFQQAGPQQSEAAAGKYLSAVRAEKERLQIQSHDVLPANYADAVVDSLTKPQGAETLATRMASEAQRWGSAWPEVYRQVQKDLPDAALVIGSGIPKRAADTLALMSSKSNEEIKALVPAGRSMNDIEKDTTDDLSDVLSTFGPEGSKVIAALRNSTVKTAIGYMASGSGYKDAISQAANDIANSRYTVHDFRDQTYRVPAEVDADAVDAGATYFLQNYEQAPGTVQTLQGTPEKVMLGQATNHVRQTGYWRTAPDESGLRLYVNNAVVPGAGGKPVQLSWEALRQLGGVGAMTNADQLHDVRELQEQDIR